MSDGGAPGRRIGIVVIVAGLLLAVAAWFLLRPGKDDAAAAPTLTIGDQRGGVQSLLRAAGELDNVPYKIEWALFPAASPLLEALNSGAVDVGGIGGPPFAFAYAGGAKIKVIFAYRSLTGRGSQTSAIVVPGDSPLRSLADIKGKRLATVRGSAGQDLAIQLLERHGMGAGDVKWTYLNNSDAKAALGTGAIDAWSSWGSYIGTALLHDHARSLADGRELPAQAGFYAATDTAIATKRVQLADLVQRLARARIWVRSHKADYAHVLSEETGLPLDVARFNVAETQMTPVPIDESVQREQQAILERYRKAGLIETVPSLDGAFDPSFSPAPK
ncbi:ABC transporter substrate-binding protein [soil metagenome]